MSDRTDFTSGNGDGRKDPVRAASEAAGKLRDQVGEMVSSAAREQKERAADGAERVADAARDAARRIHDNQPWFAGILDRAADSINEFSQSLREGDFRSVLDRTERFAREQPMVFTGVAFVVGMLIGRATRASPSGSGDAARSSARR